MYTVYLCIEFAPLDKGRIQWNIKIMKQHIQDERVSKILRSWLALSGAVSIRFPPGLHAACLTDINPSQKHLSNRIIVLRRMQQN